MTMSTDPRALWTELAPDGRVFYVDWDAFRVGCSVFVPAFNVSAARSQVRYVARLRGWEVVSKIRVEDGRYGVRFWRTK